MVNTSMDFWRMVWDENSSVIIMLNRIIENNRLKCHPYWPTGETDEDGDADDVFSSVDFTVHLLSKRDFQFYAISELDLVKNETNENRRIYHLHYYDWPDFGVPECPTKFLDFLKTARKYYNDCIGPPVVHCSAGIGRTGTLVLVDTVLNIVEQKQTLNIDIYSILVYIRQHRLGLVQTPDQLRFCFRAIIEGVKDFDTKAFTNERIVAELEIDLDSSEGSVEYMESEEESDYVEESSGEDEMVAEGSENDEVEEDDIILQESDINVSPDSRDDGIVSPSSIDFLPPECLETPEVTPEPSESVSPMSDTNFMKDAEMSPEVEELPQEFLQDEVSEDKSERIERKEKLTSKVQEIKEKLKAHDAAIVQKAYYWNNFGKPLLFGSAAAVGLSILIYMVR